MRLVRNTNLGVRRDVFGKTNRSRNETTILSHLAGAVTEREKKKGQLHKVFTGSFDARGIYNQKFFNQKLQYIHRNPVSGKWNLVKDYTEYEHSSASFYETGLARGYEPFDYRLL